MKTKKQQLNSSDNDQVLFSQIIQAARKYNPTNIDVHSVIEDCTWYLKKYDCEVLFIRNQGLSQKYDIPPLMDRCFLLTITLDEFYRAKADYIRKTIFGTRYPMAVHTISFDPHSNVYNFISRLFCDTEWKPLEHTEEMKEVFTSKSWLTS